MLVMLSSNCPHVADVTMAVKDIDQTVRIVLYSLIFLLSVLGNSLIIAVLVRNRRMRTVTNLFLLSLAVSDLMVSLVCIPFTLIPNLMRDFIFGTGICKLVMYFMGVSVSVSTFNLVAISLERYSAICNPLTSRTWQTKSHAAKVITATWAASFILMLPYPISSALKPFTRLNNSTGHMCRLVWPNDTIQQSWYVSLLLLLFLIPGIVMMTAYGLISLELYRGIKCELNNRKSGRGTGTIKQTYICLFAVLFATYYAAVFGSPVLSRNRQTVQHGQHQARRQRRLLPAAVQKEEHHSEPLGQQADAGPRVQQQLHGQPDGQEARDPHAPGHRLPLLPVLDPRLRGQRVAGLRPPLRLPPDGRPHLLHPPAVLHLRLRQPHYLLLHEQALPPGHAGHLHLLQVLREERGSGRRAAEVVRKWSHQRGSGQVEVGARDQRAEWSRCTRWIHHPLHRHPRVGLERADLT
ncbi:neuropeptide Y receptor type 2 isoform X2 [Betta splendens]|uniref:Gastrin/cholecystokinin type B receptor n=1 Tax=Betta splendens TaxID=158456 RepID=A0A6P7P1P3_BETSP|nr:neuropeptide Y receptor type 2 isoform X2 [Betta splendens]